MQPDSLAGRDFPDVMHRRDQRSTDPEEVGSISGTAADFAAKGLGDPVAQMDARSSLSLLVSVGEVGNSYLLGLAVAFAK